MSARPMFRRRWRKSGAGRRSTKRRVPIRTAGSTLERRLMKRTIRLIGIAVAVLLLALLSLPFLIDANQFRPLLVSQLSQALGREVKVGDLKLSILSGGVSAA